MSEWVRSESVHGYLINIYVMPGRAMTVPFHPELKAAIAIGASGHALPSGAGSGLSVEYRAN